jgi:hypothetical protein
MAFNQPAVIGVDYSFNDLMLKVSLFANVSDPACQK